MSKKTDSEIIEEYKRDMIEHSGADEVADRLAMELLFHWIHQMNPKQAGYDPVARERLILLCRGARQVPGAHIAEVEFTTELAARVESKLWEMWRSIVTGWKAPEAENVAEKEK